MDRSRSYILDRIRSKKTSIEEFNYDKLEAPPLSWFFSPFDIQELNSIARSIKYSAKPQARYEAIKRSQLEMAKEIIINYKVPLVLENEIKLLNEQE